MYTGNREQTGAGAVLRRLLLRVVLPVLCVALAGCGFHPRGSSALPADMAMTYISSTQPYGSLVDDFSEALKAHGASVTTEPLQATAVLKIISNAVEKRVLSINTSGKVLEIELRQTVRFSVTGRDQRPLVEEQEVTLKSDYLFSSTDVLGKERENSVVRRTLQRDLVNLAMLRITAAAR